MKYIKNKKNTVYLLLIMAGLLSLVIGTSYAILKGTESDTNEQVIKTGSVKLKLTEYYDDISEKITIKEDEDGLLNTNSYEFNIKNIGNSAAKYDLKLINDVPSSYTGKVLDTKYIKIGLEINGEEYGPMSLEKVKNIIDSDIIYKNEVLNYKLRIWLDKSKEDEIEKLEDYKAFLKLEIKAEQRPDSMDNGIASRTFKYTGKVQEYGVQRDGYYYIETAGGGGYDNSTKDYNIRGAKASGYIYLKAGEKLYIYVGGHGSEPNTNCKESGYEFNGGGVAKPAKNGKCGASGGSATDIRLTGGSWDNMESLISRIMVAGGGGFGESTSNYTNGYGGTLYGEKTIYSTYQQYLSNPGTQTSGGAAPTKYSAATSNGEAGSFGKGGAGGASTATTTDGGGSGGGSGYYGASGSSGLSSGTWASSGGSSYISGYAGVNSVEESTTITHTNQTIHYSGKYFIGGKMLEGQNSGDGYAKISFVENKPKRRSTELNNVRYIKDCTSYNTANNANHWIEIEAIKDGVNIAKGKTVTGTTSQNSSYPYSRITDGDITYGSYATPSSAATNQCVTIDLGQTYDLDEVALWNYFGDQRRYISNNFQVSSDNSNWTNLSENEAWYETSNGARYNAYIENVNGYAGRSGMQLWYDGYANTGTTRNATTTTWKNLANSSYTGTITGPTWQNNYLYFDGSNDWVKITQMNFSNPTIEVVYKKDSLTGSHEMLVGNTENGGYDIYYNATYKVLVGELYSGGWQQAETTLTLNKIATAALTYDSKNVKLYTFGDLKSSTPFTGAITSAASSTVMAIGTNPKGSASVSSYLKGNIYSVRIYNKALTQEEVEHNYQYDKQKFNLD